MGIFSRVFKRRRGDEPAPTARDTTARPPGRGGPTVEFLDLGGEVGPGRKASAERAQSTGESPEGTPAGPSDAAVEARLNSLFQARQLLGDTSPMPLHRSDDEPDATLGSDEEELAPSLSMNEEEAESTLELFGNIASLYIRPVQQFVGHLRQGPYTSEGLEMCVPAVEMVTRSAESMEADELVPFLNLFNDALGEALQQDDNTVDGELRDRILDSYAQLEAMLPEAFTLEEDPGPAEDVILYSLLRQIPEVGTVTLDKVFGAGLTSVEMFELATPRDLAVTAGIPEALAQRICVRVHGYIVERRSAGSDDEQADRFGRLRSLVAELSAHHESYEDLRDPDEAPAEARGRRRHRRARQDAALKIHVVLAELGERALVDELLKLPFGDRIERLQRHLDTMGDTEA